jgi:hypothetical protein
MFEHFLILITPSGGFLVWKVKKKRGAGPERRTNLVFVIGRENVILWGEFERKGIRHPHPGPLLSRQRKTRVRVCF